jgi:hypothetical protein
MNLHKPAGPSAARDRLAVVLICFVAVVFAFGVEALGFHHHDTPGASEQCLVCRIAANLAGVTPDCPTEAPAVLFEAGQAPVHREEPCRPAPHLTSPRLRAPPAA